MEDDELLTRLRQLLPAEFETVLVRLRARRDILPPPAAEQSVRAIALIALCRQAARRKRLHEALKAVEDMAFERPHTSRRQPRQPPPETAAMGVAVSALRNQLSTTLNPYNPWQPPSKAMCIGRKRLLRILKEKWQRQASISLVGTHHIGKSSLLQRWANDAVDLGGVVRSVSGLEQAGKSPRDFVHAIIGQRVPENVDDAATALERWAEDQRRKERVPLVLVDDFDPLAERFEPRFHQRLRGIVSGGTRRSGPLLSVVLATRKELSDLIPQGVTSPLAGNAETLWVGLFDEAEQQELLGRSDRLLPKDHDLLRHWSGRHPFYLSLLAHYLVQERLDEAEQLANGATGSIRYAQPMRDPSDRALESFLLAAKSRLTKLWKSLEGRDQNRLLEYGSDGWDTTLRRPYLRRCGILTEDGKPFGHVLIAWLKEI